MKPIIELAVTVNVENVSAELKRPAPSDVPASFWQVGTYLDLESVDSVQCDMVYVYLGKSQARVVVCFWITEEWHLGQDWFDKMRDDGWSIDRLEFRNDIAPAKG